MLQTPLYQEETTIGISKIIRKGQIINDDGDSTSELTIDDLNSLFLQLQDEENQFNDEILDQIKRCARKKILISSEQFEYLVCIATSGQKYKDVKEIIKVIKIYTSIEDDQWFLSVVPSNLIERLSIFLPHSQIFEIYQYCLLRNPDETSAILTQMNIIEYILDNLDRSESILLYSTIFQNEIMKPTYAQYFRQIVSDILNNFNETDNSDFIKYLNYLIIDNETTQEIIQNPSFFSIFTHNKYNHYLSIHMMHLICSLCEPDKSIALMFVNSPVWEFVNKVKEKNDTMKNTSNKKLEFNQYFLRFLYYIGETNNGKLFLFENNVHLYLFERMKDEKFQTFDKSVRIICQIGLINDINIVTELIKNGLIDILKESILCLTLDSKRAAIDCLSNIQSIGEINDIYDLQSIIFDNEELMESVDQMRYSEDDFISDLSRALYMRYSGWGIEN